MSSILIILQYLFAPLPLGPFKFMNVLIVLAVLAIIASISLRFYLIRRKEDKIFKKLFRDLPVKLSMLGIFEGLYILVRYENMPYISIRFLNYMILAYALYVVFHYGQLYFKVYPAEKKHHVDQLKMNKYLPRKGNKKH